MGNPGSHPQVQALPDADFPMFRLADVYLMLAEASSLRNGDQAGTALNYMNTWLEKGHMEIPTSTLVYCFITRFFR